LEKVKGALVYQTAVLEKRKGVIVYQIIVLEKIRSNGDDLNVGLNKSLSKNAFTDTFQSKNNSLFRLIHHR